MFGQPTTMDLKGVAMKKAAPPPPTSAVPGGGGVLAPARPPTAAPVASAGGTKRQPVNTSTTSVALTPEQQQLVDSGMSQIAGWQPPTMPNNTVVGFNPTQTAAQGQAIGATGAQAGIVGAAGGANKMLLDPKFLDPSSNPALKGWQDAASGRILEDFKSGVMPAIGQEAQNHGQYGGSRHGVAQGIAARGTMRAIADSNANIANAGYSQNLGALLSAMGQAPTTAGAQTIPAMTTSAVGDVQQQQAQRELDAKTQADWYNQMFPWFMGQDLIGMASGVPGGTTVASAPGPRQYPLMNAIGTAANIAGAFL